MTDFQKDILSGIQDVLPEPKPYDHSVNHAPKRKDILTPEEKQLALRNALRYFPAKFHETLAPEFAAELRDYGRIYMYRFRPYLWRQWGHFPELGPVQACHAVSCDNDRGADPCYVFRPPYGPFPEPQGCSEGGGHKRHGHP